MDLKYNIAGLKVETCRQSLLLLEMSENTLPKQEKDGDICPKFIFYWKVSVKKVDECLITDERVYIKNLCLWARVYRWIFEWSTQEGFLAKNSVNSNLPQ